jgi:Ni/Fe-hydrogenase subunit HybB-like protein
LAGAALFRYNTYIIGFNPGTGHRYFPAVGEIMVTLGIISLELMAYLIFIKTMPVLPSRRKAPAG